MDLVLGPERWLGFWSRTAKPQKSISFTAAQRPAYLHLDTQLFTPSVTVGPPHTSKNTDDRPGIGHSANVGCCMAPGLALITQVLQEIALGSHGRGKSTFHDKALAQGGDGLGPKERCYIGMGGRTKACLPLLLGPPRVPNQQSQGKLLLLRPLSKQHYQKQRVIGTHGKAGILSDGLNLRGHPRALHPPPVLRCGCAGETRDSCPLALSSGPLSHLPPSEAQALSTRPSSHPHFTPLYPLTPVPLLLHLSP